MDERQKKYEASKKGLDTALARRYKQHQTSTRDSDGDILFPRNLVNEEAWMDYVRLYDELLQSDEYYFQTSNQDLVINTVSVAGVIRKKIKNLPKIEQTKIMAIQKRMRSLSARVAQASQKAFGKGVHNDKHTPQKTHADFFLTRGSELIEYFGRYFTCPEVHKIVNQEWGYHIAYNTLHKFRTENLGKISERQAEFKEQYSDVRLGHKRSRLDELTYLYNTRFDIYDDTKNREDSKEMRAILEQVRKEVEGDSITINGKLQIDHSIRVQEQVTSQLMAHMNLKAMIVARVAVKLGRNPLLLQYQLMNSYYAKLTGFKRPDEGLLEDRIVYPSTLIYDFEELRNRNREIVAEDAEFEEMVDDTVPEQKKSDLEDIKAALMKKILERKAMNKKTEIRIQGEAVAPKKKKK